jgi:hypothetical protein
MLACRELGHSAFQGAGFHAQQLISVPVIIILALLAVGLDLTRADFVKVRQALARRG